MHKYYSVCERCGALLDPGERCSCSDEPRTDQRQEKQTPDLFYDLLAEQNEYQR